MISPRDNGGHGPWGKGAGSSFDLEAFLRQGRGRVSQSLLGGGPRRSTLIAVILVAFWALWSAFYTVPSDSVAVVQRFGKHLTEVPPGLHLKIPFGVDVATLVPVKRQLKQEFGFTTPGASDPYQGSGDGQKETEMVTGDLNAALVEWVVQYRISDPFKLLFEVRGPTKLE